VDAVEIDPLIDCVLARVESGQTGAAWQRARLAAHESKCSRAEALARMLGEYLEHSEAGAPVHEWSLS
jgi:hypothetical protein